MSISKNNPQESMQHSQVATIIVPFPMQGHLNEALHLAHLIASYGIQVYYAGSCTHNRQAKLRCHGQNGENLSKILFYNLQLDPILSSSPSPNPEDHSESHSHLGTIFEVCSNLRRPMFELLQEVSSKFKRVIVIHDTLVTSVIQDVKSIPNAESYALHSVSAFTILFFTWDSLLEKPFQLDSNIPQNIPSSEGCFAPEFSNFIAKQHKLLNFDSGRIYNTCRFIEGKYIDLLYKLQVNSNKKLFALGPFNPVHIEDNRDDQKTHDCLEWLDKQEVNSVIYVSFGTAMTMTDDQIRELALGLENSEQKFIWVLRNADEVDVFVDDKKSRPQLPRGLENRVRNRGMVIRDWAPQLEILAHPSTGGFMTHCGWNSCMESISMGVPMAAWPMIFDQPRNSILVTEELKIGTLVRNWEDRNKLVTSRIVEGAVVRLMRSKEGDEMRIRAAELAHMVRASVGQDGASRLEMDSFIAHITR